MNEIEKRMNAAMDLVTWLDHRIEQQVEYQLEQRLNAGTRILALRCRRSDRGRA